MIVGHGRSLDWDPGVVYQYEVDGAVYRSQRVSFRGHQPSPDGARRISQRFKVGDRVTIWYDPVFHDQSVLIRGPGAANFLEVAGGFLLVVIGFIIKSA
jgi:hypothetical protein